MNAHQRRKARRSLGVRPPYTCVWCHAEVPGIGACPGCGEMVLPLGEVRIRDLAAKAHDRDLHLYFDIVDQLHLDPEKEGG
jgi:hypothetical protein